MFSYKIHKSQYFTYILLIYVHQYHVDVLSCYVETRIYYLLLLSFFQLSHVHGKLYFPLLNKKKILEFCLTTDLGTGFFEPFDLTKVFVEAQDLTTLGFSIGKFGLSLSNFSLHNLTDIGCQNKTAFSDALRILALLSSKLEYKTGSNFSASQVHSSDRSVTELFLKASKIYFQLNFQLHNLSYYILTFESPSAFNMPDEPMAIAINSTKLMALAQRRAFESLILYVNKKCIPILQSFPYFTQFISYEFSFSNYTLFTFQSLSENSFIRVSVIRGVMSTLGTKSRTLTSLSGISSSLDDSVDPLTIFPRIGFGGTSSCRF
ncbi:hypothetical protein AGLY_007312 [Aphis glycines]|uniref:Uncharacterized protein n=1 Tax=Aphis glycines TaxID=307491 RepID=A0A6G0TPA4_APHGL|nr:hypothetical protein AGLY_007312 [Aphis glycines]